MFFYIFLSSNQTKTHLTMKSIIRISSYLTLMLLLFFSCTTHEESGKDASLQITKSKDQILADGNDFAEIVATKDGQLSSDVKIYSSMDNEFYDSPYTFTTRKPGTYQFSAYDENTMAMSEPVTVEATRGDLTTYHRRELILEFTYTTCPNCPSMMGKLDILAGEIPETFEVVAVHFSTGGDPMYSGFGDQIGDHFGINAAPSLVMGFRESLGNVSAAVVKSYVQKHNEEYPADAGIKFNTAFEGSTLNVEMSMKANVEAEYSYGLILVENGLKYPQMGTNDPDFTHNHVMRDWIRNENGNVAIRGVDAGKMVSGEERVINYSFDIDSDWNKDNLQVVGFVCNKNEEGEYVVINTYKCNAGENADYDMEK